MSIQNITDLNIDFNDKRYIKVNAKQYDRDSRVLSVTCTNNGVPFHINPSEHSAFVRCRKPDEYGVFNSCSINNKGKVLIVLTEQMLAAVGLCYVDLIIVGGGNAKIDAETGKITNISDAGILSSMTFCIDVQETVIENATIESTYEFDGLNDALAKMETRYNDVITVAQSFAEEAEYWAEEAKINSTGQSSVVTGICFEDRYDAPIYNKVVTITPSRIGAVSLKEDVATVAEVMVELGITTVS